VWIDSLDTSASASTQAIDGKHRCGNQKLRRRTVRRPSAETRPSLCNEGLIPGALLLGEPAESHQGKYGEEKKERKEEESGRLFMGMLREGNCR